MLGGSGGFGGRVNHSVQQSGGLYTPYSPSLTFLSQTRSCRPLDRSVQVKMVSARSQTHMHSLGWAGPFPTGVHRPGQQSARPLAAQPTYRPTDLIPRLLISQIIAFKSCGRVYAKGSSLSRAQKRFPSGDINMLHHSVGSPSRWGPSKQRFVLLAFL